MTPGEVADEDTTKSLEGPINSRLLKLYIGYARRLRPVMTHQAQTRIKEHYTKLRNVYHKLDDQDKTMPITPRQLESIIRLAEANAKMHLSDKVDLKHAERAIDLMELFLKVTLGGDVDFMFFGADAEQRRKETDPRLILLDLIANGPPEGMDKSEILDLMDEKGFNRKQAEKLLDSMVDDGDGVLRDGYDKIRRN